MKKHTSQEIVRLFSDKIEDCNLISEIFDYLHFDCKIRTFIDYEQLDESIKNFYELKNEEALNTVIEIILAGKEAASMNEKTFLKNIKAYIVDHLYDNVSVEEIASVFHVSYYYLCHLFKKLTNKTINQFKTE
jgi:YesN/AraC family two-component response regulator